MSDETSEDVIVIKEQHIPVSKDHFLSVLLDKFESEKAKQSFGDLASCVETLFYVNRIAKIEGFKQCYSCFSRLNELKHNLSYQELSARQLKLMNMVYSILKDAHFAAITFEMYKNSIEKVFLSDLPIKVDWGKLDPNLLTQFYEKYPAQNPYKNLKLKPPFFQHFAMFYRGYGLNTMTDLFITPKLNLILADLIPIMQSNTARFIAFVTAALFSKKTPQTPTDKTPGDPSEKFQKSDIQQEIDMLKLKRISLLDTYNAAKAKGIGSTLWWFFKNIKIQEPTFKRLMLIYRPITESFVAEQTRKLKEQATKIKSKLTKTATQKLGLKLKQVEQIQQQKNVSIPGGLVDEIGRKRKASLFESPDVTSLRACNDTYSHPIRIQYFSDIPMSDLEVTYPAKQFSLKPMDNLYLTFTISIGVWAMVQELLFATDSTVGYWMVMLAIFLMIRSLIWYRATESEYVRVLNQALVDSNVSSDMDTILSLMDAVDEQQFMETILAYFVILNNKDAIISDSDEVDRLCEELMREEFGEDVHVMIDGAMSKLSELGLFKSGNDESIKVKGLLDALSCVHSHYQSAIQMVRKITVDRQVVNEDDEKKMDLMDGDESEKSMEKTPPTRLLISPKEISGDHFGKNNDVDDDNIQLVD